MTRLCSTKLFNQVRALASKHLFSFVWEIGVWYNCNDQLNQFYSFSVSLYDTSMSLMSTNEDNGDVILAIHFTEGILTTNKMESFIINASGCMSSNTFQRKL